MLPIGIGSVRFFHCLTLDLQAEVEQLAFRLGKASTFRVFTKSETNWIWHVFIPWTSGTFSFCHSHSNLSSLSSSSKNLCGSGLSKLQRQHHMKTYCETDGCIVECPRSLCFKTMWRGKKIFNNCQDPSRVWVPATLETPRKILGPTHPITGVASSMCPRAKEMQLRSIHHVCKLIER